MTKASDNEFPHVKFAEGAAPSTPASGFGLVYEKTDGKFYGKNDAGTEYDLTAGGGGGTTWNAVCNGRLTLTSGTAVTTADVTAATSVYFTPYAGNQIGTYSGSAWSVSTFTEKTLSLSGLTADTNYDIFIVDSTLALEAVAWSTDTTRATALVLQDGVLVKSGATTRRYLGTIRITSSTGQCEDSVAHRFVWNYYNRFERPLQVFDSTDTWTYATATWRAANGTTTNHRVDYVCGYSEDLMRAEVRTGQQSSASAEGEVGIGVDSTSANSAQLMNKAYSPATAGTRLIQQALYRGFPGIGYHSFTWLEYAGSGATITFYGDDGTAAAVQSGIVSEVWG
jgi:hypothetical protein